MAVVLAAILVLCPTTAPAAGPETGSDSTSLLPIERDPGGDGYRLFGGTLWLAGDATISGTVPEHGPASVELDDVSLLIRFEPTPRLSFFSETRLEDTVILEQGRNLRAGSGDVSIERLYADVLLTPNLTLRIGKILTPFGLWNVIRRAPLSWTVERPPVTAQTFPEHATGLNLIYQATWHGWSLDATGYGPVQDQLAFRESQEGGFLGGGRLAAGHVLGDAFATIGSNAAAFEDNQTRRWAQAYGLDGELDVWGHQLTTEFTYDWLHGPDVSRELGCYVQDAFPVMHEIYGVLRFDYIQPRRSHDAVGGLVGVFWHPIPTLIIKLDYQFANHRTDNLDPGFLGAVSLFF